MLELLGDTELLFTLTITFAAAGMLTSVLGFVLVCSGYNKSLVERIAFRLSAFNVTAALIFFFLRSLSLVV